MFLKTKHQLESVKQRYIDFMKIYLSLEHMEQVPSEREQNEFYYLPHHAVVKIMDPESKICVVHLIPREYLSMIVSSLDRNYSRKDSG